MKYGKEVSLQLISYDNKKAIGKTDSFLYKKRLAEASLYMVSYTI